MKRQQGIICSVARSELYERDADKARMVGN